MITVTGALVFVEFRIVGWLVADFLIWVMSFLAAIAFAVALRVTSKLVGYIKPFGARTKVEVSAVEVRYRDHQKKERTFLNRNVTRIRSLRMNATERPMTLMRSSSRRCLRAGTSLSYRTGASAARHGGGVWVSRAPMLFPEREKFTRLV